MSYVTLFAVIAALLCLGIVAGYAKWLHKAERERDKAREVAEQLALALINVVKRANQHDLPGYVVPHSPTDSATLTIFIDRTHGSPPQCLIEIRGEINRGGHYTRAHISEESFRL